MSFLENHEVVGDITLMNMLKEEPVSFVIPSYQRGYRWTGDEAQILIDDLVDFAGKKKGKYSLQPIVVQKIKKACANVVDGQQRLTTLKLIIKTLIDRNLVDGNLWSIRTRDEATQEIALADEKDVSTNVEDSDNVLNLTSLCIDDVRKTIEGDDNKEKLSCIAKILDRVQFTYYKLPKVRDTENGDQFAREVFRRLNSGRIALTSAELIRAFFMEPGAMSMVEQQQICVEWEQIANQLQDDAFWHMFNNSNCPVHERMDALFRIVTRNEKGSEAGRDAFRVIEDSLRTKIVGDTQCNNKNEVLEFWWKELLDLFWMLRECFSDVELYHYIGWLRHARDVQFSSLYEIYKQGHNAFKNTLRKIIVGKHRFLGNPLRLDRIDTDDGPAFEYVFNRDSAIPESYRNKGIRCCSAKEIRGVLLFYNIERLNQLYPNGLRGDIMTAGHDRFPFELYDDIRLDKKVGWDVEHVNSFSPDMHTTDKIQWAIEVLGDESVFSSDEKVRSDLKKWLAHQYAIDSPRVQRVLDSCRVDGKFQDEIKRLSEENFNSDDAKTAYVSDEHFEPMYRQWCERVCGGVMPTSGQNNRIGNLVLLDAKTNRLYHNSIFSKKRSIVDRVESGFGGFGHRFVPRATSDVFKKAYSSHPLTFSAWTLKDIENYEDRMANVFAEFMKKIF